ncbi:MAG: hypothetical protein IJ752_03610 [Alphaproteobacteria bacterium]|nr:hypothetical protein [Alphaproteobacteria bacterium]
MTYLRKSAVFGLVAVSFLFRIGAAHAIPVPTIGAELATQIDQLTKHIDELKKVKDQITNGIEQAKAMGDKLSMDALKNFAKGQAQSMLSGGMSGVKIPQEMSKAGFSESVMKDPEKIAENIERLQKKAKEKFDTDVHQTCVNAKNSMAQELSMKNLANSFALQQNLATGEDMKKAQEASSASDDQMQLLGANTATLKVIYQQAASSTAMAAGNLASSSLDALCN